MARTSIRPIRPAAPVTTSRMSAMSLPLARQIRAGLLDPQPGCGPS